jgi:hypothetical protein
VAWCACSSDLGLFQYRQELASFDRLTFLDTDELYDPADLEGQTRFIFRRQQAHRAQGVVENCHLHSRDLHSARRRDRARRALAGATHESGKRGDCGGHPNDHDVLRHG